MSETNADGQLPSEETESSWKDKNTPPGMDSEDGREPLIGSEDEDEEDEENDVELEADGPVREDPEPLEH